MKHWKILFMLFFAALFVGDRLGAMALHQLLNLSENRFARLYNGGEPDRIVIIGNSRADRHFPSSLLSAMTGKPVLNLGLGSVTTMEAEALLADFIEHNGQPALVIVEPTNLIVENAGLRDLRLFASNSKRLRAILRTQEPRLYWAGEFSHLFRFNNPMLVRVLKNIGRAQGDRLLHTTVTTQLVAQLEGATPPLMINQPKNEAALARIIGLSKQHGFPLHMVITPFLPGHGPSNVDAWINQLSRQYGDLVPIWNYANAIDGMEYFTDRLHLNARGVVRLLNLMQSDGHFRTHGYRAVLAPSWRLAGPGLSETDAKQE
ncbi:MAG: hypothetical protein HQ502_19965 [Alphaproteobacteria bacterium]|nr:hypothetical protein [Alphaproteobacteria bacterium]